ncbi:MAG: redoxin domain-containing protein [Chitinophagaceae bacterium]|nr:redoxin domain-containing protein [Chitinophagaceae bacterium]
MKKTLAISVLLVTFACIFSLFWYSEWRYSLPTPIPAQYHAVNMGAHIDITAAFRSKGNKPVFLHFFNPDCPCSRFNIPHFKGLAKTYGEKIDFAVVVMTKDKNYTESTIREKYGLTVPVLFDTSLARTCGVYSTPQAVLLSAGKELYYRGNYNRSRYCTDKKSNYAQTAIDSLLASRPEPFFNKYALTAYGCSLPGCKK